MQSSLQPPHEHLKLAKLLQERLVRKKLNVLVVVVRAVGSATMVDLLGIRRFMGVDALEYAEPSEVGQRELELLESLVPGNVPRGHATFPLHK